jgi:hypothetical protein
VLYVMVGCAPSVRKTSCPPFHKIEFVISRGQMGDNGLETQATALPLGDEFAAKVQLETVA